MASSQLILVGLRFTANTTLAKLLILNLLLTLLQIGNTPISITGGGIESAVLSAKLLEIALQKAVNIDTGKLNFTILNKSLISMGTNVTEVGSKLLSMGPQGQKAFLQLAQSISLAEIPARKLNGVLGRFADTLLRTIRWQVASTMIHGFISTVRSAVSYIEDLDKSLNSIQRITLKNDAEMANFAKTANKMAGLLSTVTKEYSNASLIFFQQGLDTAEVIERTNATIKLAKVTGDSVENISSKLTAIWNNFDDGTKSLEYYADVITKLGASTASSSDEIATGLLKFAAVADTVGLSYERATAALATVVALTRQSAEIVGTSFKTIFARVEGLKLGETLEDDVTLNQYSAALAKIGVNILDSNNNLKDMDTILDDLGNRWNKLSEALKVATAQTVAGVRQYSQFLALMDNYELVRANENLAKDSKGTLDKQFKTYQESIEALDKEIEKAKLDIFAALFNADDLKGIKEGFKNILETISKIVSGMGGLKGIITLVGTLLILRYIPNILNGINSIVNSFSLLRNNAESSLTSFELLTASQTANINSSNISESISKGTKSDNYVSREELSLYYTNQILVARKTLLDNLENMTLEQKASILYLLDYISGLADTADKLRLNLDLLRETLQVQEDIVAKENQKIAYMLQRSENNITAEELNRPFSTTKEALNFNYGSSGDKANFLDTFIERANEVKSKYADMSSLADKYTEELLKNWENEAREIEKVIEKLLEYLEILRGTKEGNKAVAGQSASTDMANLNKTESNFRNEHREELYGNQTSAYLAGIKAMDPAYSMGIDPNLKAEEWGALGITLTEITTGSNMIKDNFTQILSTANALLESTATTGVNWSTATESLKGLESTIKISEESIKNISNTAAIFNGQSKLARSVLKDINATLKQSGKYLDKESKTMKNMGTSSKKYQTNLEKAKKQLTNSVTAAEKVESLLRKAGGNTDKLRLAISNANAALKSGHGMTKAVTDLSTELGNTALNAQKTGNELRTLSSNMANAANTSEDGRQALLKVAAEEYNITLKSQEAGDATLALNEALATILFPTGSLLGFVLGLGTVLQTTTSAIMGILMLSNGVNMLSDAFAGNGDAITTLTGAMMALRGIMLLVNVGLALGNKLTDISAKSKLKESYAAAAATRAKIKEAAALGKTNEVKELGNLLSLQELIIETQKKSITLFGPIAGVAIAAVATASLIAMTAISTSSKKTANHLKAVGELAQKTAEDASKTAESAKEEYNSIKKLYDEYEKLYKNYKDTGEEKLELYNKTKELIDKLDLENYKLELLAGNYDLVNNKIRELILLKTNNMVATGEYASTMASKRISTAVSAENSGFSVIDGRFGVKGWAEHSDSKLRALLGKDYLKKYGVYIDIPSDTPSYLTDILSSFTFSNNTLGAFQFDKFYENLLKESQKSENNDYKFIADFLYLKYLDIDSSTREALDNSKKEFTELVNNLILKYNKDNEFTNINDLDKIYQDLYDSNGGLNTNSEIFKSLAKSIDITHKPIRELKADITKILDLANIDLEKLIISSYGSLGELYNLLRLIVKDYGLLVDFNLDEILKAGEVTLQEFFDLFSTGKLNFNLIDWSKSLEEIQKLVKELIKKAQEAANEKTVDFEYTLSLSAQKNWKSGMTYSDITKFLEEHTDLFNNEETGEKGVLGTKEDFLSLSITEQKKKIEEASELINLLKLYEDKISQLEDLNKNLQNKDNLLLRIFNEGKKYTKENLTENDVSDILEYIKADEATKTKMLENWGYGPQGMFLRINALDDNDKKAKLLTDEDFLNAIHTEYLSIMQEIDENLNAIDVYTQEKDWLITLTPRLEFEKDIALSDLDIDEIDDLVENIPELVDSIEELDKALLNNKLALLQVALAIKQTEKGLKTLTDNYEDWKEALKGKDELAKVTALKEMKDAFADIFDMTDELKRTDMQLGSYFGNYLLQNMDLVEKAADGDKDAILQLQRVAAEDILLLLNPDIEIGDNAWQSLLDNLNSMQELLDNNQLKIGEVDDTALKTSLALMINDLGLSTDLASALLAGMGFDAEIVELQVPKSVLEYVPGDYVESPIPFGFGDVFNTIKRITQGTFDVITGTEMIPTLKIKSLNYVGGGNISTKKGGTGRLSNKKSGNERSKKELKKASDESERYHSLNKTLDSLSKQYSRVSSAKDAAFGVLRLKYIEKENKLLQQLYITEKALLKEIKLNYSKDRSAIEAYGAIIDKNGVITNYDQIMKKLLNKLNNAYTQYNAGGLSDEIIEAREKEYEEFKKILSQFEETNELYLEQLEKVEEAIRQLITNALEGIKAKVELELEIPNLQLKMIEFKLRNLEDRAFSSSEKIALWGQLAEIAAESFNHYAEAFKNVLTMAVYDKNGNKTGGFGLTSDLADRLMSGDANVLNEAGITGENAQEIIEALKEYQDNLLEEYDKVREARKSVEEELLNQLNEYTEAIELQISKLEKLNSIANNYKTLINTTGKELLGISADIMNSINTTILNTSKNLIAVLKAELDALETNLEVARLKLANAMASSDEDAILYWKKANEEIENSLLETKDTLLSILNDYVEAATEILKEKVQESFDNLAKTLYGMTFEDAQASYDRYKTLSDDYLKDYLKIYELSKLTRQVELSIDNTDNLKAKKLLRDLLEEINEYQAEGLLMTQYEVDYLNKKYELRKAEIALEEAQNAKDQVRLSRNVDGGWGYVYTANLLNIDKAQQTYEDKLYALQELNTKAIESTQSTILLLLTEYQNAINELFDLDLSEEDRNSRIQEITDYYSKLLNTQYKTLNSALGNNQKLYEEDWNWYNTLIGYRISADQDYIDKFEETWLGKQLQSITSALDSFELYKNTLGTYDDNEGILGRCYSAFTDYLDKVKKAFSTAGIPITTFANGVETDMGKIKNSSEKAKDEGVKLADLLETTLPGTMDEVENVLSKTTAMFNTMKNAIEGVNNALTLLILYLKEYNGIKVLNKNFTPPTGDGSGKQYVASINSANASTDVANTSTENGDLLQNNKNKKTAYSVYLYDKNKKEWVESYIGSGANAEKYYNDQLEYFSTKNSEFIRENGFFSGLKEKIQYTAIKMMNNKNNKINLFNLLVSDDNLTDTQLNEYFPAERNYPLERFYLIPLNINKFDTGGYTGTFGPEGRLAMLHEKELVLNKQDTSNMLKMVDIARLMISGFKSPLSNFTAQSLSNVLFDKGNNETNQSITIEAHFPNAINHLEIEEAFRNLANYSAQNAYNLDLQLNINIF